MLFSVGGYALSVWFSGGVGRLHLILGSVTGTGSPQAGAQNWLLVGTDSRVGTGTAYGGTALVQGQRSDTAILAHLATDGTTTMVSIPRDTLVTIPSYIDSRGRLHAAHADKFNAALDLGGPQLVIGTLSSTFGLAVDHYAAVDLAGFTRLSDAVGGVTVCQKAFAGPPETGLDDNGRPYSSTNLSDPFSGWRGRVGEQTVQGAAALAFVRQRHGLPRGDLDRIARQQQFLGAVFRKATSSGVLTDPVKLLSLISAVKDALTLDDRTSVTDLESLATRLRGADASRVRFVTMPTRQLHAGDPGVFTDSGGILEYRPAPGARSVGNVQLLDQPSVRSLLDGLDRPLPPTTAATEAQPTLAGGMVTVAVVNGAGRPGLARGLATQLARRGFRLLAPATAPSVTALTQVHYPPGQLAAARTVQGALPVPLVSDPQVHAVTVLLGSDYRPSTGTSTTTGSPTPGPQSPAAGRPAAAAPQPMTASSPGNQCTY